MFLLPDYFDGWRRASDRERALRLKHHERVEAAVEQERLSDAA